MVEEEVLLVLLWVVWLLVVGEVDNALEEDDAGEVDGAADSCSAFTSLANISAFIAFCLKEASYIALESPKSSQDEYQYNLTTRTSPDALCVSVMS